ncbi:MAG: hypothetical protein MSH23_07595 [Campylobacter lanienae]|nr:hypothetical protein [Campylobacter lanienae]MCI7364875.1 hypothetical protein [Campylobacter lanienae]
MKLVKLSLSAIISVATISSVSNAKTLEDNRGGGVFSFNHFESIKCWDT